MSNNKNLIGSILIALASFAIWGWALPAYDQISAFRSTISDREVMLSQRQAIIANIKSINAEYQRRLSDINKLSSIVPEKKSVAEVVSAFEDMSSKNGLQLVGISVAEQKSPNNTDPYNLMTIDLNLNGSYISLLNFLASVEKNIRLIDVSNIDVGQSSSQQILNFRIKANAYYLKNING